MDLSQFEAGPAATQLLGWLGAEVIKVERPGGGEQGRRARRRPDGSDGLRWMLLNANKSSLTLDMKEPRGREVLEALLRKADVLVENFGPGAMERLGFSEERVAELNPALVYARVKGFGAGEFEGFVSVDPIAQATAGAMSLTGPPDGPPTKVGMNVADAGTALHAAVGILAALHHRTRTGLGQVVRVNLQDSVANMCRVAFAQPLETQVASARTGNSYNQSAPSGLYPCAPGGANDYCLIYTIITEPEGTRQWHGILRAMEREDLRDDARFATAAARRQHSDLVDELVSAWTRGRTKREVMRELLAQGVPAGAVNDTLEVIRDPDFIARDMVVEVEHPTQGPLTTVGMPITLTASPAPTAPAPELGAQTEAVLAGLLGLAAADIESLRAAGVV
ncbi:formyl-CoA transferase [Nocardioides nitrophenolicus]|nr:formyl-CoA transferase [Nocardioides nitrophenolicus]